MFLLFVNPINLLIDGSSKKASISGLFRFSFGIEMFPGSYLAIRSNTETFDIFTHE